MCDYCPKEVSAATPRTCRMCGARGPSQDAIDALFGGGVPLVAGARERAYRVPSGSDRSDDLSQKCGGGRRILRKRIGGS